MKIVVENLGLLSNDEVLAVLKDREADKQPVISRATTSEIQAYTELLLSSGCPARSREQLQAFVSAVEPFSLTKSDIVQLANCKPASDLELSVCVAEIDLRLTTDQQAQLLEVVQQHLRSDPSAVA